MWFSRADASKFAIDGGGSLSLDEIAADVRLRAEMSEGGAALGVHLAVVVLPAFARTDAVDRQRPAMQKDHAAFTVCQLEEFYHRPLPDQREDGKAVLPRPE
jgi:hypothetical protein